MEGGADMKATVLDMRRNPKKILDAIERNETVTLTNRGKSVARIEPLRQAERPSIKDQAIFGMWADRDDMSDPVAYVRALRKGRFDAV
jgi:antitoxin (DNA-binding transcriptional repressor) of toxin-antitoxin stability system